MLLNHSPEWLSNIYGFYLSLSLIVNVTQPLSRGGPTARSAPGRPYARCQRVTFPCRRHLLRSSSARSTATGWGMVRSRVKLSKEKYTEWVLTFTQLNAARRVRATPDARMGRPGSADPAGAGGVCAWCVCVRVCVCVCVCMRVSRLC